MLSSPSSPTSTIRRQTAHRLNPLPPDLHRKVWHHSAHFLLSSLKIDSHRINKHQSDLTGRDLLALGLRLIKQLYLNLPHSKSPSTNLSISNSPVGNSSWTNSGRVNRLFPKSHLKNLPPMAQKI